MWDSPWVVSTIILIIVTWIFIILVLYGILIQLQVKWHIATLSLKFLMTVRTAKGVMQSSTLIPHAKCYKFPWNASLPICRIWLSTHLVLQCMKFHKQTSNIGTHIKVRLLSAFTLNQVKHDCACLCSFSFFVSALCLCSQDYYLITCNQRWKWLFSNQESTKPPRDMQG